MNEEILFDNSNTEFKIRQPEIGIDVNLSLNAQNLMNEVETEGTVNPLKQIFQSMLEKDPNAVCPSCRFKPLTGTCSVCGTGKVVVSKNFEETPLSEVDRFFIPHKYRKEKFSSATLTEHKKDIANNASFIEYKKVLDAILVRISSGQIENRSYYISAPAGFGKETFAYTVLQMAMANGMTIFPYIDLGEAERLMNAYQTNHKDDPIKDDIGFSDVELYTAKVVILKVPHNNVASFLYKAMLTIIDRRARRGLPTIILSRYRLNYFTSLDTNGEVRNIVSYSKPSAKNLQVFEVIL